MRKCILSFLLVMMMALVANGQLVYMGGGMNFTSPNNKALNQIVDEYNGSRSYLSKPMNKLRFMKGGQLIAGVILERGWTVDLTWTGRNNKISAEGIDATNTLQRRDIKVRNNSFGMGLGWHLKQGVFRPGFMVSTDFSRLRTFTRIGPEAQVDDVDYTQITKDMLLAFTIAPSFLFRFGPNTAMGLLVRPYYQLHVFDADLSNLDLAVNPGTYSYSHGHKSGNSNFGVQVSLLIIVADPEPKKQKSSNYTTPSPKPTPQRGDMKRGSGGGR